VGYIAETLTCQADQLVPVPPSIPRAQEARGSLTRAPRFCVTHPFLSEAMGIVIWVVEPSQPQSRGAIALA
jgi:hypothetical protein